MRYAGGALVLESGMAEDRYASRRKTDEEELTRQAENGLAGQGAVVESMRRLRVATQKATWVMGGLTAAILVLTAVLVWQGFK